MKVLIAGGGIGGLAAALAVARSGRDVTVLEKADEFGEIGAGIQLAPNASRALDALGVLEAVHRHAVFPQRIVWMDARSGEHVTSLDLGEPFRARYGYPYLVMHRSDLLLELLAACEAHPRITLRAAQRVTGVSDGGDHASVQTVDGGRFDADLVVGADGLWSTIRPFVEDDGPPVCSAYVAYRGAIPMDEVSEHAGRDNVMLWTGPDQHLVQYPIRRGELYNQVAVFRSRRFRGDAPDSEDWGTAEELDEHFGVCAEPVRRALPLFHRNRRWPMYDRAPIGRWTRGRVTLIGDAAHPMLQYLAQGAAQALEDAAVLGTMLAAHGDLDAAVAAYVRERAPRTAAVQTAARRWGDWWHDEAGFAGRNARLRARRSDDYEDADWLYAYGATR